jgi:hypothetical protein
MMIVRTGVSPTSVLVFADLRISSLKIGDRDVYAPVNTSIILGQRDIAAMVLARLHHYET